MYCRLSKLDISIDNQSGVPKLYLMNCICAQMCIYGFDRIYCCFEQVSCKVINVTSGAELPERCRELALHFENQGTPIMIGQFSFILPAVYLWASLK